MAILALRGRVGPEQRETVLVIFDLLHGDVPALNGVTLRTVRAHPSLVHVGMTVLAILPDIRENRLYVTLCAFYFFMHTAQRIAGLVVIEFQVRLDRAPRGHLVAVFARDGERRPVRIARIRPDLLMGRLCSPGGLRIRWWRASHTGEGKQNPEDELERCRRKFPLLWRAGSSPAGKGPKKLGALCADSRGEATVRAASSGPVGLCTGEQSANGQTSEVFRRRTERSRSGATAAIRDRGSRPHEPSVGDADPLLSPARLASYNFSRNAHTHLRFQARNASSTARRLARRISEYFRDRITPSAPARRAARTASRTSCGSVFFSP